MHHGFSSSHFKGPCFYSWVHRDTRWQALLADTGGHLASLIWWATPSREPSSSRWARFRFRGKSGWEKEADQTQPQGQQERWVLYGPTKAWVTRDLSPFPGERQLFMYGIWTEQQDTHQEQRWPQVILSRLLSWAPFGHVLQLKKSQTPHHQKTTLKYYLVYRVFNQVEVVESAITDVPTPSPASADTEWPPLPWATPGTSVHRGRWLLLLSLQKISIFPFLWNFVREFPTKKWLPSVTCILWLVNWAEQSAEQSSLGNGDHKDGITTTGSCGIW